MNVYEVLRSLVSIYLYFPLHIFHVNSFMRLRVDNSQNILNSIFPLFPPVVEANGKHFKIKDPLVLESQFLKPKIEIDTMK